MKTLKVPVHAAEAEDCRYQVMASMLLPLMAANSDAGMTYSHFKYLSEKRPKIGTLPLDAVASYTVKSSALAIKPAIALAATASTIAVFFSIVNLMIYPFLGHVDGTILSCLVPSRPSVPCYPRRHQGYDDISSCTWRYHTTFQPSSASAVASPRIGSFHLSRVKRPLLAECAPVACL